MVLFSNNSQRLASSLISDLKLIFANFIRVHENKKGHFESGPNL